jgi:membrane protease YdiL (CAAX protease family)
MPTQPPLWEKPLWFQCLLLVTVLFSTFAVLGILTLALPNDDIHTLAVINSLGLFLLPSLVYAGLVYRHPLQEAGFTHSRSGWYYLIAACIMLASLPLVQAMTDWNARLHLPSSMKGLDTWIHKTEDQQDSAIESLLKMPTMASLFLNLLVMAFFTALGEEALFRGVFQKLIFRGTNNIHKAVFWGAVIFSALHFQFLGFFPRVVLGIILGYLYAYSGSLWPSIIAHFVYNGSQVLYEYFRQHQPAGNPAPFFRDDFTIPAIYTLISLVLVIAGLFWMKKLNPQKWP